MAYTPNLMAASDMGQLYAYNQSIYDHFARWRDYLDFRTYQHVNRLAKRYFDQLPRAGYRPTIVYGSIHKRLPYS